MTLFVFMFWHASKKNGSIYSSTVFILVFSASILGLYPENQRVSYLWVIFCLGVYGYGERVTGDHVWAACYAVLATHFGGWLYEIPFLHPQSMFYSVQYPWLVNMQILSGVFCLWLLTKRKIKPNKTMLLAALGYCAVSLFYIIKPPHPLWLNTSWWLSRGLTMLLLWAILTGIKGENKKMNFAEEESV